MVTYLSKGFQEENFENGVAMVPKPKSEAWLICAVKDNPYQHCDALEDRSGNDKSPKALKPELEEKLDGDASADKLVSLLQDGTIDIQKLNMPSFRVFRDDLVAVVKALK